MTALADLEPLRDPDQLRAFTLCHVARALGVTCGTVRGWADRGYIRVVRAGAGTTRRVPLAELERLARDGWPIDVEALLDTP